MVLLVIIIKTMTHIFVFSVFFLNRHWWYYCLKL